MSYAIWSKEILAEWRAMWDCPKWASLAVDFWYDQMNLADPDNDYPDAMSDAFEAWYERGGLSQPQDFNVHMAPIQIDGLSLLFDTRPR